MPAGVSISGQIIATIDGRPHHAVDFADGLVFALSADSQEILGFSYTTGQLNNNGFFRIDGLPRHGDIILIAFKKSVKRMHWMDLISLDELELKGELHESVSIGIVQANMNIPSGSITDLSSEGKIILKGKALALQSLLLVGWISFRSYEYGQNNYTFIDELTNRLYKYYNQYLHSTVEMIEADYIKFNTVYSGRGITKRFFDDNNSVLAQHMDGRPNSGMYGLMRLKRYKDDQNLFIANFITGHGGSSMSYRFGIDENNQFFVDYSPDGADEPLRLMATSNQTNLCTVREAAQVAARHFHYCNLDSNTYEPYKTIDLNLSGRQAFIFGSCAGPETRGRASFVLIERLSSCTVIGEYGMTYDMYPKFRLSTESIQTVSMANIEFHNTNYGDLLVITEFGSDKHTSVLRFNNQRSQYSRIN